MGSKTLDQNRWSALWTALGGTEPAGSFDHLAALYAEPHRRYHTAAHVVACLSWFDHFNSHAHDPVAVEFALWLHDAIYDPMSRTNEAKSADLAEAMLLSAGVPERAPQVRRLIEATQHDAVQAADDAGLVVDIDLSVLALPWPSYRTYVQAVREEYSTIPEPLFRAGRIQVLNHFLALPTIYTYPVTRDSWEALARANLQTELKELANDAPHS